MLLQMKRKTKMMRRIIKKRSLRNRYGRNLFLKIILQEKNKKNWLLKR